MGLRIKNSISSVCVCVCVCVCGEGGMGGGGEKKTPIYRGNCLKRGTWTVCRFKRGLGEKGLGGVIPRYTLWGYKKVEGTV